MDLIKAENIAKRKMREHLDNTWSFAWNNHKTTHGVCSYTKKTIYLSRFATGLSPEKDVLDTILHEIGHAIAGWQAGHGPKWKAACRTIGLLNPQRCKDLNAPTEQKETAYTWVMIYGSEIVKGYYRKPGQKTFDRIKQYYVDGKPETRGKLKLVPYASYKRTYK